MEVICYRATNTEGPLFEPLEPIDHWQIDAVAGHLCRAHLLRKR
jgi:hypothetical protein